VSDAPFEITAPTSRSLPPLETLTAVVDAAGRQNLGPAGQYGRTAGQPPDRTVSTPPLLTTVPVTEPPESTTSFPPPSTLAPDRVRTAPLDRVAPLTADVALSTMAVKVAPLEMTAPARLRPPPLEILTPLSMPPAESTWVPAPRITDPLARPPDLTVSTPPALTTVPVADPPDAITSAPPLSTLAPDRVRIAPLDRVTPLIVTGAVSKVGGERRAAGDHGADQHQGRAACAGHVGLDRAGGQHVPGPGHQGDA